MASAQSKCVVRKGYKKRCKTIAEEPPLTLADAHKARVQRAQSTAMSKLMDQIGKPYRWGGTSPRTGFDCSGLVYYAYKDLVKSAFRAPPMRCIICAMPVRSIAASCRAAIWSSSAPVARHRRSRRRLRWQRQVYPVAAYRPRHPDHLIKRRLLDSPLCRRTPGDDPKTIR